MRDSADQVFEIVKERVFLYRLIKCYLQTNLSRLLAFLFELEVIGVVGENLLLIDEPLRWMRGSIFLSQIFHYMLRYFCCLFVALAHMQLL